MGDMMIWFKWFIKMVTFGYCDMTEPEKGKESSDQPNKKNAPEGVVFPSDNKSGEEEPTPKNEQQDNDPPSVTIPDSSESDDGSIITGAEQSEEDENKTETETMAFTSPNDKYPPADDFYPWQKNDSDDFILPLEPKNYKGKMRTLFKRLKKCKNYPDGPFTDVQFSYFTQIKQLHKEENDNKS